MPSTEASVHQPTLTNTTTGSRSCEAAITVMAASAVAEPALSNTAVRRNSPNRTGASGDQLLEQVPHPGGALDHDVRLGRQLGWALVGAHANLENVADAPAGLELVQATEGIHVGEVVADIDG